jgi:hypothetical protein
MDKKQVQSGKPFFGWMNFTRMHLFTHVRASMRGQSGMPDNEYADGMIEMDINVGKLMKFLTISRLRITPSLFLLRTTVLISSAGPMLLPLRSAVKKIPTGKAPTVFRPLYAGLERLKQIPFPTVFFPGWTGFLHFWRQREIQQLKTGC